VREGQGVRFHEAPPPSREQIEHVAGRVRDRAVRFLAKHAEVAAEIRRLRSEHPRWNFKLVHDAEICPLHRESPRSPCSGLPAQPQSPPPRPPPP
jgi:hypothetical protein